jgi:hypothetical protein
MAQAISIPEDLYDRLRETAEATRRPLEDVVVRALRAGLPPSVSDVSEPLRSELARLETLSDTELWHVWHSHVPEPSQARHLELLERRSAGRLTPSERKELSALRGGADRLLLLRAHAAALLRWRGHGVPLDG